MGIPYLEVKAVVRYGKEEWEGVGYFEVPTDHNNLPDVFVVATRAVVAGLKALILVPERPKLELRFSVLHLGEVAASKVKARQDKLPIDDYRQILWQPVGSVDRWGVEHGG